MATPLIVKIKGGPEITRQLRRLLDEIGPKAVGAGIYAAGNKIMRDAKRLTPVDTGALRGSGYVTLPESETKPRVELGFGGQAQEYAIPVHERTEVRHEVGQAKFLEAAVNSNSGDIVSTVARVGRRALEEQRGAERDPSTPTTPEGGE